jgi:hypothetical protein
MLPDRWFVVNPPISVQIGGDTGGSKSGSDHDQKLNQ